MTVDRKILWGIAVVVIWFTASIARAETIRETATIYRGAFSSSG